MFRQNFGSHSPTWPIIKGHQTVNRCKLAKLSWQYESSTLYESQGEGTNKTNIHNSLMAHIVKRC